MKKVLIFTACFGAIALVIIAYKMNLNKSKEVCNNDLNIELKENIKEDSKEDNDVDCDISYILDNEKKDAQAVENKIDEEKAEKLLENESGNIQPGASGEPIDYKSFFNDTIFLGDSLTEYISAAEILPERNVMAEKGNNVSKALANYIDKLKYENPKRIIMLFGTNDVVYYTASSKYKTRYLKLVQELKKELPNTIIYIESPTPIRSDAEREGTNFNNEMITEYRKLTEEVAKETESEYIDITTLIKDDSYFEEDGIHFKYDFYEDLLNMLCKEIQDREKK